MGSTALTDAHAVMLRLICAAVFLTSTCAANAQSWQFNPFDDGSYFSAHIAPNQPGFTLLCGERSPQGVSPSVTGNFEPDITPPDALRLYLSDQGIGPPGPGFETRDDVLFVIGTQGYRLRQLRWNELYANWQTDLPANDGVFRAIAAEPVVELRSKNGSLLVPMDGFTSAYRQLRDHCVTMFAAIGNPWTGPAGAPVEVAPTGGAMQQAAENAIALGCNGGATRSPGTFLTGDIDGDGIDDVVLDWRAVACLSGQAYPYCGASQCSADVFLSSTFSRRGQPYNFLALGVRLQQLDNGNMAVALGGSLSTCSRLGQSACEVFFYWNGYDLVALN
jgi:hypothetical protein